MGRRSTIFSTYYILFWDHFSFAMSFPLFPLLLLHPSFNILSHEMLESTRNFFLGIVLIAFPVAQFFGAPFFGGIADRFGRRKAYFWTLLGSILGYCLTALGVLFHSYSLILFSRFFTGFFAGNLAISMAVIVDLSTSKTDRTRNISAITACLGMSWILAVFIAIFFINHPFIPSLPFWIISALFLTSLFILGAFFHETHAYPKNQSFNPLKGARRILHLLDQKQLRVLYLSLFFWLFGFVISLQWVAPLSIEKYHATETQIMWLFIGYGIAWTLSSGIVNIYLAERFSLWKMNLWSLFSVALFFFFAAVSDFLLYFTIAYALSSFSAAMAWSNSMSLISVTAQPEEQGRCFGLGQAMASLAQFLAPLFGGFIAGVSTDPLFFISSFLVTIAFLLLLVYVLQRKNKLLKKHHSA